MTRENIMNSIGCFVFVLLSAHYRNDQEKYLAVMKFDRQQSNMINSGINPHEYREFFDTEEQVQSFLNNIDLSQIPTLLEGDKN